MDLSVAQSIGKRVRQEDFYGVKHFPTGTLAVVCDGMGGHSKGNLASQTAVNAFIECFDLVPGVSVTEALSAALLHANICVGDLYEADEDGGGCTLVATFVTRGSISWISVGDSPLFLWRGNRLIRLNADHSMRSIYSDLNCPSYYNTQRADSGHLLRSAVTGGDITLIDAPLSPYPVLPRDRVIVASDGIEDLLFYSCISPELTQLLNDRSSNLSASLVAASEALDAPYADNITVLTMDL